MSKVVFLGSPAYALPSLQRLVSERHEIALVICQPDKKKGRGLELQPCAVAQFAQSQGLRLYQPISLRAEKQQCLDMLQKIQPDFICCVAYGQIIPTEILEFPRIAALNAHASLLPKWRGAAPINWSLLDQEPMQGVAIQKMVAQLDAGDLAWQKSFRVHSQSTYSECLKLLADISAEGFAESLKMLAEGENAQKQSLKLVPQPTEVPYPYAGKLNKDSALLFLQKSPEANLELVCHALAPISYLSLKMQGVNEPIQLVNIKALEWQNETLPTSLANHRTHILWAQQKRLFMVSQAKLYEVMLLQKQGKNVISGRDFINSHFKNNPAMSYFEWNIPDARS